MPFSKYDPHREPGSEDPRAGRTASADRRAKILKYGWWITMIYTAIGFVFLGLFWLGRYP